jgi:hypothetical protein
VDLKKGDSLALELTLHLGSANTKLTPVFRFRLQQLKVEVTDILSSQIRDLQEEIKMSKGAEIKSTPMLDVVYLASSRPHEG